MSNFLPFSTAALHEKWLHLESLQSTRLSPAIRLDSNSSPPSSPFSLLPSFLTSPRNRYPLAEPFSSNRIKLDLPDGMNDYINASPIHLGTERYIAAQGPLSSTVTHFYRMIVGETTGPVVVVMLGPTHENGVEKCFPYFPRAEGDVLDIPVDNEAGDEFKAEVRLERVTRHESSGICGRDLRLRTSSTLAPGTQIIHYEFSAWADHSVPSAKELLHLINMITSPLEDPIIVHCSAGCGRTGTFIALHYLLGRMRAGKLDGVNGEDDPVMEIMGEMRRQRMAMVQKEEQFLFLYEVLRGEMDKRREKGRGVGEEV